jgi:hypothetical protein
MGALGVLVAVVDETAALRGINRLLSGIDIACDEL